MGHGHGHAYGSGDRSVTPAERTLARRLLVWVVAPLAVVSVAALVLLWPSGESEDAAGATLPGDAVLFAADVTAVEVGDCRSLVPDPAVQDLGECRLITAILLEGPDDGEEVQFELLESDVGTEFREGDRIVLLESEFQGADPLLRYTYYDHERSRPLWILVAIFVGAVLALGRWRGAGALVGLAFTILIVVLFLVPAILEGSSPVLVSVVAAAVMMIVTLYAAHGFGLSTTVALFGTLGALVLTALLAATFTALARISGLATEEAMILQIQAGTIDMRGLLLGGIIIGFLGVLDDVTVTQSSAVWELRDVDRSLGGRELYRRGLRVGRDHVASTVNTLFLAYTGAAIPLFVLLSLSDQSIGTVVGSEVVAVEIISTLVGSIGLVAAVPLTTGLAALAARTVARQDAALEAIDDEFPDLEGTWWDEGEGGGGESVHGGGDDRAGHPDGG